MRIPLSAPALAPARTSSSQSCDVGGSVIQSRSSGRASSRSISAQSATVRACGPMCATVPIGESGYAGTLPKCALMPTVPVKAAGMRTEPPPSVPTASGPSPAAIEAHAPPEDPPGVVSSRQGLRVIPVSGESVLPRHPNSGVVVLPNSTAPASLNLAVAGASSFQGPAGSTVSDPRSVGQPRVRMRSLIDAATPSSAPQGEPACQRASLARAAASADSPSTRQNALSAGFSDSIRPSSARVTSTGESRRWR